MTILLFFLSLAANALEKISFKTTDGQTLKAIFIAPKRKPVVIMLHGLASAKEEWNPLIEALSKKGWGVLAYDARGHGESSATKDENGAPNGYKYFGRPGPGTQWEKMIDDVGAAIRFIRNQKGGQEIPIFLCGASVGANVVLNYASLSRSVKGVILLSPGLNYAEIKTEGAIRKIKNTPILIVASAADSYAFESSTELKKLSPLVAFWSDVKPGHGVQMFDDKLIPRIITWLEIH